MSGYPQYSGNAASVNYGISNDRRLNSVQLNQLHVGRGSGIGVTGTTVGATFGHATSGQIYLRGDGAGATAFTSAATPGALVFLSRAIAGGTVSHLAARVTIPGVFVITPSDDDASLVNWTIQQRVSGNIN